MSKYIDAILVVVVLVMFIAFMPMTLLQKMSGVTEESFDDKKLTDLCYKIQTEKRIDIEDFYYVSAKVEAYADGSGDMILVSWAEIENELENNGTYVFTEKYVRVIYDNKKVKCLRIN